MCEDHIRELVTTVAFTSDGTSTLVQDIDIDLEELVRTMINFYFACMYLSRCYSCIHVTGILTRPSEFEHAMHE